MDVARLETEALATAEPVLDVSDDEEDEEQGFVVVHEAIKPVLFNTPFVRLVKILLGATLCTVILNPPNVLRGIYVGKVQAPPPAARTELPMESELASSDSIVMGATAEAVDFAEAEAEAVAEKVSAIIAPGAATYTTNIVIRSAKKQKKQTVISEAMVDADATHHIVTKAGYIVTKAGGSRSSGLGLDADAGIDVDEGPVGAVAATTESQVAENSSMSGLLLWRGANWLPHLVVAVVVLTGFAVHLRSHIVELLQNLPELVARKIRA